MATIFGNEDAHRLAVLASTLLRSPTAYGSDDVTGEPVFTFVPPLSGAEQAVFDRLRAVARSRVHGITPAEWEALEPRLGDLRAFRTQSGAEFSALTAAQRDSALRTALIGVIDVLRAMLRD